jgi:uncharacterized integral membrane protein
MKPLKYFFGILIIVVAIKFLFDNYETFSTEVAIQSKLFSFQYFSSEISYFSMICITFVFGLLVGGLYGFIERYQLRTQIKRLKNASKEQEEELNSLRNLPITSDNVSGEL